MARGRGWSWVVAAWWLGACNSDSVITATGDGTEDSGATATESSEGLPVDLNVMPECHLIEVPPQVLPWGSSVADYDGDGLNELVALVRTDSPSAPYRYEVYRLLDDQSALVQVDPPSDSSYAHTASLFPMRMHDGPGTDAVRIETAANGEAGLVPLLQGRQEAPMFRTQGDPLPSVTDIDGDGWSEVAVVLDDRIQLLESDGASGFTIAAELPTSCFVVALVPARLDADADDDLVVIENCPEGPLARVYLDDAGPLVPAQVIDLPRSDHSCLADLDRDPHPDLIIYGTGDTLVYLGTPEGTFLPALTFPELRGPLLIASACADFDGDGLNELLVEPPADLPPTTAPRVLLTLLDDHLVATDYPPLDVAFALAGDLNNDGCQDLFGLIGPQESACLSHCN